VSALGFLANGKKHGNAGRSYSSNNVPPGIYEFGVRVGGLFGTDIPCFYKGKQRVKLNSNATVILNYNGKSCRATISQKK
jgi:hypothetical protein